MPVYLRDGGSGEVGWLVGCLTSQPHASVSQELLVFNAQPSGTVSSGRVSQERICLVERAVTLR